jgi:hypothetical protein
MRVCLTTTLRVRCHAAKPVEGGLPPIFGGMEMITARGGGTIEEQLSLQARVIAPAGTMFLKKWDKVSRPYEDDAIQAQFLRCGQLSIQFQQRYSANLIIEHIFY